MAQHGLVTCWLFYGQQEPPCVPSAYRFAGYPVALGVWERLFGGEPGSRLFQAVLIALTVYLACTIVPANRLVVGVALAANALMYIIAAFLITETLFTFLVLLLLIALHRKRYIMSGALLGLVLLTRGNFIVTLPLLAFVAIPARKWLVMATVAVAVLIPRIVRNAVELHAFIPLTDSTGLVLYGANNKDAYTLLPDGLPTGEWGNYAEVPNWHAITLLNEMDRNSAEIATAIDFVRSQPATLLIKVVIARILDFWGRVEGIAMPTAVFIAIAPIGVRYRTLSKTRRRWPDSRLLALCLVFIGGALLNTIVFYGTARFTLPVMPEMGIAAALLLPTRRNI